MFYDARRDGAEEVILGDALHVNVGRDEFIGWVISVGETFSQLML